MVKTGTITHYQFSCIFLFLPFPLSLFRNHYLSLLLSRSHSLSSSIYFSFSVSLSSHGNTLLLFKRQETDLLSSCESFHSLLEFSFDWGKGLGLLEWLSELLFRELQSLLQGMNSLLMQSHRRVLVRELRSQVFFHFALCISNSSEWISSLFT